METEIIERNASHEIDGAVYTFKYQVVKSENQYLIVVYDISPFMEEVVGLITRPDGLIVVKPNELKNNNGKARSMLFLQVLRMEGISTT